MTNNTEAHRLFREAVYAYGGLSMAGENEDRAAAIIAAKLAELRARIEAKDKALRKIATLDEDGLAEYTPGAMVAIARQALEADHGA